MKIRYIAAIVRRHSAGVFLAWRQFAPDPASETHVYQFAPVTRADVSDVVSATGSVEAQDSVEVGTQVSGTVERVLVDFNAPVEQGQLLAMLDPDVLDSQVQVAEAELMRAEAQLEQAQANLEVNQPVFEKGFLSENEFVPFRVAVKTAQAARLGAQANLDRPDATANTRIAADPRIVLTVRSSTPDRRGKASQARHSPSRRPLTDGSSHRSTRATSARSRSPGRPFHGRGPSGARFRGRGEDIA
jgi:HlyD family secretion protein